MTVFVTLGEVFLIVLAFVLGIVWAYWTLVRGIKKLFGSNKGL